MSMLSNWPEWTRLYWLLCAPVGLVLLLALSSLPKNQHGTAKTAHKIIPRHLSEKKLTITPP